MRWLVQPNPNPETVQSLAKALAVPVVVAQLLVQRGITNFDAAKQFFRPDWHHLHDPFLMKDMDVAVGSFTTGNRQKRNRHGLW